jgi:hypothetical protein
MKLNKDKQINYDSSMVLEGHDANISATDMHKLWDLLQNPYKNPIGAIVREYVSNSFDAHAEADFIKNNDISSIRNEYSIYNDISDEEILKLKTHLEVFDNDAVHVKIAKDDSGWYWSTQDFGVGLSPSRVKDVFCSYLKSTKEDSDNVIGAFGIGSKSGLSYADIVYIQTRYNGIEYQYLLRKGEKMPRLDKISECSSTERNGTRIKIYINQSRNSYDRLVLEDDRFKEECNKQLAYFDNVYFDGCDVENNYKILRGAHWIHNDSTDPFDGMHMCLGKVAYPIDWDNLSCEKVSFPVALKFEIGELDIIQTREDVKYTPRTKKAILDKIEAVKEEWKKRWEDNNILDTDDFIHYIKNRDIEPEIMYEGNHFNLALLFGDYSQINYRRYNNQNHAIWDNLKPFTFTPFKNMNIEIPEYPFFDYECNKMIREKGLRQCNKGSVKNIFKSDSIAYRIKENHVAKKSKYIREELESFTDVYLIRKKSKTRQSLVKYKKELKLKDDDKANWRTTIKLYQDEVLKSFLKNTESYDRVVVDKEWTKDTYGSNRRTIDKTKIISKQLLDEYIQGNEYSYHRKELIKCDIDKCVRPLKLVASHDDRYMLKYLAKIYMSNTSLKLPTLGRNGNLLAYTVSPTNMKYFKDVKNVVTLESFMKKENKVFVRAMTIIKYMKEAEYVNVRKFITTHSEYFKSWKKVYEPLANELKFANEYIKTNGNRSVNQSYGYSTNMFENSCYEVAKEHDLFDYDFLDRVKSIEKYFNGLDILEYLDTRKLIKDFPYIAIAKYIRNHNKAVKSIKQFKKLNPYYYVMFNEEEVEFLKTNEKEYEFVKEKQNVELKKVS